uniref:Uncharacterized protein LOC111107296 n=2 Tax=Crassostrea virginica TaxID=6565 RepID=A0A8B8B406_CRAVI|nr:uncharacterized protein LOC111107296 [Crassostrea virginica]
MEDGNIGDEARYQKELPKDQKKDDKSHDEVTFGRRDGNEDTDLPKLSKSSAACSSDMNTDFIIRHVNSIVHTVQEIMNCSLTKCDATQHERHHEFLEDPEKVYKDNHLKYCFGTKYITAEGFEYLQNMLDQRMCTNKFLPGSIFSRYSTFSQCTNDELEKIFIGFPLMGRQYFKFVILKEAVVQLVCQWTGMPYVQADKMCSSTELSVSDFKNV